MDLVDKVGLDAFTRGSWKRKLASAGGLCVLLLAAEYYGLVSTSFRWIRRWEFCSFPFHNSSVGQNNSTSESWQRHPSFNMSFLYGNAFPARDTMTWLALCLYLFPNLTLRFLLPSFFSVCFPSLSANRNNEYEVMNYLNCKSMLLSWFEDDEIQVFMSLYALYVLEI